MVRLGRQGQQRRRAQESLAARASRRLRPGHPDAQGRADLAADVPGQGLRGLLLALLRVPVLHGVLAGPPQPLRVDEARLDAPPADELLLDGVPQLGGEEGEVVPGHPAPPGVDVLGGGQVVGLNHS